MGSYPLQILPADPTAMGQFGAGLGNGLASTSEMYAKAAILKKMLPNAKAAAPVDYAKIIPQIVAGIKSPEALPDYEGIRSGVANQMEEDNPGMGDMLDAQANNPESVGEITDADNQPFDGDYGLKIKEALLKNYFPGSTQADVQRKVFGMPPLKQEKPDKAPDIPPDFVNDFKLAHDSASGDENVFVENLKGLAGKYSDNPKAIDQIQKLINMNKPKKSSGSRAPR